MINKSLFSMKPGPEAWPQFPPSLMQERLGAVGLLEVVGARRGQTAGKKLVLGGGTAGSYGWLDMADCWGQGDARKGLTAGCWSLISRPFFLAHSVFTTENLWTEIIRTFFENIANSTESRHHRKLQRILFAQKIDTTFHYAEFITNAFLYTVSR